MDAACGARLQFIEPHARCQFDPLQAVLGHARHRQDTDDAGDRSGADQRQISVSRSLCSSSLAVCCSIMGGRRPGLLSSEHPD